MLALKTITTKLRNREFTTSQVSAMLGMPNAEVNNLVDEVAPLGVANVGSGRRLVQYRGLMPLLLVRDLINYGLKPELRQQAISKLLRSTGKSLNVPGTVLSVLVNGHRDSVARGARALYEAEDAVISKPTIMRGEPCVSGTRIPAYLIADIVEDAGIAEAKRTYPQLSNRQIENACFFAKATPRRGRPKEIKLPPRRKSKQKKTVVVR